jgi:osmoprotectant transport system ATP-binding protein
LSIIRLENVSKRRGATVALHEVSIDFAPREVTAILGASGSGKTTLLHLINGLLRPDSGRINVFDQPIDYTELPALRRQMGYAVQSVGLFPHLTIAANLSLAARLFGSAQAVIEARIQRLLGLMQLNAELLQRYPHELSGGQRQRIGICRAMMLQPKVLLLDEPFSGVDPITRGKVHEEFIALMAQEPTTTVLVTHDVTEASRLATQLIIIDEGRVRQHGPIDDVRKRPASPDIAALFEGGRG